MRTGVIIQKKAGQLIPSEYLEVALKQNPNAGGFAIQDKEEDGDPCVVTESSFSKAPTLAEIDELQKTFEANTMLLWLGNGEFNEKSAQPFVINTKEGPTVLACMLEGDFSKYVDTKSEDSDEQRVFEKVVEPLLLKAWKYAQAEGTYEAFIGELDSTFEQSLLNAASHRCVFAFMPVEGDPIAFGNNELGEVYDWGTVSNKYDYAPGSAKEQEAKPEKKKGWFNRNKAETKPSEASPSPAPVTKPDVVPAPAVPDPKTDTAIPASDLKGHYETMPDTVVRGGHKAQKTWIRKIYNLKGSADLPEGWRNQRKFFIPDAPIKDFQELKERMAGAEIIETEVKKDMKSDDAPKIVDKKVEAKAAPKSGKDIKEQRQVEANLMTMSVEEQTKASTAFATFLDYKSKESPNPLKTKEMEAKYPKFTDKVPVTINEMLLITPEQWGQFQQENPKAFLLAMIEMKNAYISSANIKLEDLISPKGEVKEEEKTIQPSEMKKGGFSSMFKKTA